MPTKVRFIEEIGTRVSLRVYWGDTCTVNGYRCCHTAKRFLFDTEKEAWTAGGVIEDYKLKDWPTHCEVCGLKIPEDEKYVHRQIFRERLYNTESGKPEPGDMYYESWYEKAHYWDNQDGPHLIVVLPNGVQWNIDSRANNCTRKEDRTHRCWCRHGEPPNITVDKVGDTCNAGSGSILAEDYYGWLKEGVLT